MMTTKQTLLDKAVLAGILTMLMGFSIIGYMYAVCMVLRYSSDWAYDPARLIGWAAIALMLFVGMIVLAVSAIRIMPNKKN